MHSTGRRPGMFAQIKGPELIKAAEAINQKTKLDHKPDVSKKLGTLPADFFCFTGSTVRRCSSGFSKAGAITSGSSFAKRSPIAGRPLLGQITGLPTIQFVDFDWRTTVHDEPFEWI